MYVDLLLLFLMYAFSSIALLVSIYALWTLKEVEEYYKKKNAKQASAWNHYHAKAKEVPKSKGHWGSYG